MTSCEATGPNLFSSKESCVKKCGIPPINCYTCFISPNEKEGRCILTHPVKTGTNEPVDKCSDSPNAFSTMEECRRACVQKGPVTPVAKCWAIQNSESCKCTYGEAIGPHGPLQSCEQSKGFYNTQSGCVKACEAEHQKVKNYTWLWILLGVGGGIFLLLIIGIILYFVLKKNE